MPGLLFDYTVTPNPWTDAMQGQTATVTVTGKTQAMVPLTLMSYKTTKPARWPQHLYQIDSAVLDGCETVTLQVEVPECHYQIDFTGGVLTSEEIESAIYLNLQLVEAMLGGNEDCFGEPPTTTTTTTPPTTTTTTTTPPNPPTTPAPPVLPPVLTGAGNPSPLPVGGKSTKRACSSVTAKSYRVRAKQKNTITVRVKTTSKTKPKVTLRGAGLKTSKRVSSKGTVTFKVKPKRSGSIRVTASGCTKVAKVKVLSAKKAAKSGTAPTFTG